MVDSSIHSAIVGSVHCRMENRGEQSWGRMDVSDMESLPPVTATNLCSNSVVSHNSQMINVQSQETHQRSHSSISAQNELLRRGILKSHKQLVFVSLLWRREEVNAI